jgi:GDP-4-dehydro-6-deoxy-D-mannose reductase
MIGTHLAELLVRGGHEVLSTHHNPTVPLAELAGAGALEPVDVTDWCSVMDSLDRFRPAYLFHLAAQSYPVVSWERPVETMTVNVLGTLNVLEAVRRLGLPARVIVACSSAEYGEVAAADVPVREERRLWPVHPYGTSKLVQDLLAEQYHRQHGLDTVRARIFNCTGPRKIGDAPSDFVRRAVWLERHPAERRLRVGDLEKVRAIVDVRDVCRALVAMAAHGRSGEVYNVSGASPCPMADVVELVLALSTRPDVEIERDERLVRTADEPVVFGDTSRLRRDAAWEPAIPLRQTIADMFEYWREREWTW